MPEVLGGVVAGSLFRKWDFETSVFVSSLTGCMKLCLATCGILERCFRNCIVNIIFAHPFTEVKVQDHRLCFNADSDKPI